MCNSRRVKLQCEGDSGDGSDEEVLRPRTAAERCSFSALLRERTKVAPTR
jgi:hypothetical protein